MRPKGIFLILGMLLSGLNLLARDYKASLFGVKSDGRTLNTGSIQKAIDTISENGGGRLVFYVGRYLTGTMYLRPNVILHLEEGAVLVGAASVYEYRGPDGRNGLVVADSVTNCTITGKGVIEGQGGALLQNIREQKEKGYLETAVEDTAPYLVWLSRCDTISISGVILRDACRDLLRVEKCKELTVSHVGFFNQSVPGSGGITLDRCDRVKLTSLYFDTSGAELTLTGLTDTISTKDCVSRDGRKITEQPE